MNRNKKGSAAPQAASSSSSSQSSRSRVGKRQNGLSVSSAPQSYSARVETLMPKITRTARSMRIAHRELVLSSVAGSTGFTVQNSLALNPGLTTTFPWLAPQAQQWEMYKVHRLRAEWIPIASTGTAGDVYLSPNYDASDPQPTTEVQAANNVNAVVDSVWKVLSCDLDPSSMMGLGPRKYVRPCAVAGDIKTFDIGKLFVCSNNEANTNTVGKLYLSYDFEFFTPQNDPSPAS